jgi:hypothetical protein
LTDTLQEIELTQPEEANITSQELIPVIALIEDAIVGQDAKLVFFACLAIATINSYPGMTDEQISTGISRIAQNIVQMAQEFEFENKMKERVAAQAAAKTAN